MLTAPHQGRECRLHPASGRLEARVRTRERGTTMLEFTVIAVLLLTLVFGIIDFGRALYTYHCISYAAHAATRWASVRGSNCTDSGCPATPTTIQNYVQQQLAIGIANPTSITVNTTWQSGNNIPGNWVRVQVQYNFQFLLPFLPANLIHMASTSQMVISQ
jgi:Flp pilus assembly protein TadG